MTSDQIIAVLAWSSAGLLLAVVALACWIVVRTWDAQNKRNEDDEQRWNALNKRLTDEFHSFGKGLTEVRDLLTADIHNHSLRIQRLEDWRGWLDRQQQVD